MVRAEQNGLPLSTDTIYYGPEDAEGKWPDKITLIGEERQRITQEQARSEGYEWTEDPDPLNGRASELLKVTWDQIRDCGLGLHAHVGYSLYERRPEIAKVIQTIVRNPRDCLTSAAERWFDGDLVECLRGKVAMRGYVGWCKDIWKLARLLGFAYYERQPWDDFRPGKSDWRDVWSDAVEDEWVNLNMDDEEWSLGYRYNDWEKTKQNVRGGS